MEIFKKALLVMGSTNDVEIKCLGLKNFEIFVNQQDIYSKCLRSITLPVKQDSAAMISARCN